MKVSLLLRGILFIGEYSFERIVKFKYLGKIINQRIKFLCIKIERRFLYFNNNNLYVIHVDICN